MIKIGKSDYVLDDYIRKKHHSPRRILISGGIGDVFAIECFFPYMWYDTVEEIVLATRATPYIRNFFENKIIPFKKAVIDIVDVGEDVIYNIGDLPVKTSYNKTEGLFDCSIQNLFNLIALNELKFKRSCILERLRVDISKFNLCEKYVLICPSTSHDKKNTRNFTFEELEMINGYLRNEGIAGVIVDSEKFAFSGMMDAIDLSGKTTLEESIGILRHASGFISIDSCLSVLACQIFAVENMLIKSKNEHYYGWLKPYTSPLVTNKMAVKEISIWSLMAMGRSKLIRYKS